MTKKKQPIVFPEGSVEAILSTSTTISKQTLALPHSLFQMKLEGDDLIFTIKPEIAREFYYNDIIEDDEITEVSFLDLILSPTNDDSFNYVGARAGRIDADNFDAEDERDNLFLLCTICYSYFMAKFSNMESLQDITRPVPTQLFVSMLSKHKEMEIMYKDDENHEYAGKLNRISVQRTPFGAYILLGMNIISKGKDTYVMGEARFNLPLPKTASKIEDIGLVELTPELKERFTERGRKYVNYTKKPSYCMYKGFAHKPGGWWGDVRTSINGRVMVDINAMRALNSELDDSWYTGNPFNNNGGGRQGTPTVADDALWMCSPVVFGFAFGNKDWARMSIADISEIEFSDRAFDELIVPDSYKDIFIACLTNDMPSLDSIEGKGSGKIFLLYGPPGCGKTMTAESVAESLRLPLYFVSVGELGISPHSMEENLSKVMQVAASWNAVVLLDEVDVFAVKRTGSDIQRNAMTAILLRLLERYDGILFMTTNLLDNLDDAFISRATATIPYEALDDAGRASIWKGLLGKAEAAGIKICPDVVKNLKTLATNKINGRQIKNNVRLAFSVAKSKPEKTITMDILNTVLELTK